MENPGLKEGKRERGAGGTGHYHLVQLFLSLPDDDFKDTFVKMLKLHKAWITVV